MFNSTIYCRCSWTKSQTAQKQTETGQAKAAQNSCLASKTLLMYRIGFIQIKNKSGLSAKPTHAAPPPLNWHCKHISAENVEQQIGGKMRKIRANLSSFSGSKLRNNSLQTKLPFTNWRWARKKNQFTCQINKIKLIFYAIVVYAK